MNRAAPVSDTTATLHVRRATAADIPALLQLVTDAYRGEASRVGWTTEADLLEGNRIDAQGLEADLSRARSVILVATDGTMPVACAHVADDDGVGYFGMFAVQPRLQGLGIGKRLLAEAERLARDEWDLVVMRMTVIDVRVDLMAFYERHGYRRTGIHKPFPYGNPRYGTPLRDDLRFEVLEKPMVPAGAGTGAR